MNPYEQLIIAIKRLHELSNEVTMPSDPDDIPDSHVFLLFMIYRKQRIKTIEISDYFSITPGAATAVADKLEKLDLVSRNRDLQDRRIIWIELTGTGLKYVEKRKTEHIALFEEILLDYRKDELEAALQTLNRLADSIASYQSRKGES